MILGLTLMVWTNRLFATVGHGTLAPWEPPQKLVVRGVYRHVRNPMITGALCILLGEAIFFGSWWLLGWFGFALILNLIYIPLVGRAGTGEAISATIILLLQAERSPVDSTMEAVEGIVGMMDVSQILPNLFVGTYPKQSRGHRPASAGRHHRGAERPDRRRHGHWGVNWNCLEAHYREAGVEVRRVPVRDFDPDDLRRKLPKCVEVLDELCARATSSTSTATWA